MYKPNYNQKNIVNLVSTISKELGNETIYNTYEIKDINSYNHIVLLVIDGLGYNYLMEKESFLKKHTVDKLEGAFPLTTAASNTVFSLGVPAHQHGLTGWFVFLKEVGAITTVLPFTERYWGSDLNEKGFSIKNIMNVDSITKNSTRNAFKVMDKAYAYSAFSKAVGEGSDIYGEVAVEDYFARIIDITENYDNTYIHCYIGSLDTSGHAVGINHPNTEKVFYKLDHLVEELSTNLENALVLVTADHGMLDTDDKHIIRLDDYPEITECMSMPLSGDTRVGYCYIRLGYENKFLKAIHKHLGEKVFVFKSSSMVDKGWFGDGDSHPMLKFRVGDYCILAKDKHVLYDNLGNKESTPVIGHHSGISDDEVYVPLIMIKK